MFLFQFPPCLIFESLIVSFERLLFFRTVRITFRHFLRSSAVFYAVSYIASYGTSYAVSYGLTFCLTCLTFCLTGSLRRFMPRLTLCYDDACSDRAFGRLYGLFVFAPSSIVYYIKNDHFNLDRIDANCSSMIL